MAGRRPGHPCRRSGAAWTRLLGSGAPILRRRSGRRAQGPLHGPPELRRLAHHLACLGAVAPEMRVRHDVAQACPARPIDPPLRFEPGARRPPPDVASARPLQAACAATVDQSPACTAMRPSSFAFSASGSACHAWQAAQMKRPGWRADASPTREGAHGWVRQALDFEIGGGAPSSRAQAWRRSSAKPGRCCVRARPCVIRVEPGRVGDGRRNSHDPILFLTFVCTLTHKGPLT